MMDAAMHGALVVLKPVLLVGGFVLLLRFVALIVKMKRG